MNQIRRAFTAILLLVPLVLSAGPTVGEGSVLLKDVTIVDGLAHPPEHRRDVLIVDGRIQKISVTGNIVDVPAGTTTIDDKGLTVMPGLIDLHVHIAGTRERVWEPDEGDEDVLGIGESQGLEDLQKALNAHLYAGVTSVQDTGNDHEGIVRVRDEVESGVLVGPNIYAVGGIFESLESLGGSSIFKMISPEVQAEINERLDLREAAGIKTIKIYAGIPNWAARHITKNAHARGMRAIADLWCTNLSLTAFQVTEVDGFAHGGCFEMQPYVAEWMAENDKFAMLTLTIFDNFGGHRAFEEIKTKAFMKDPLIVDVMGKETVQYYHDTFYEMRNNVYDGADSFYRAQLFENMSDQLANNQANLRHMYEAGVLIGTGTDAPVPAVGWPGEALHHELKLHVDAGIPNLEVIKMATYNGAKIIGWEDDIGSVEEGKIADLLIVNGKPWEDIDHTRNVAYVIKGGEVVDRDALKDK